MRPPTGVTLYHKNEWQGFRLVRFAEGPGIGGRGCGLCSRARRLLRGLKAIAFRLAAHDAEPEETPRLAEPSSGVGNVAARRVDDGERQEHVGLTAKSLAD